MNMNWLLAALGLCVILLGIHLEALVHYWYWVYPNFDIPMHILGGIALGAFLIALGVRRWWVYAAYMVAIVVGWEIFEYMFGLSTHQPHYWRDTVDDMFNGLVGSAITYSIKKYLWH